MTRFFQELYQIARGVIEELSDQNAYRRHLKAHSAVHSPEEWRRFQDEHGAAQSRRAKCC